jgi:hypothetical protein
MLRWKMNRVRGRRKTCDVHRSQSPRAVQWFSFSSSRACRCRKLLIRVLTPMRSPTMIPVSTWEPTRVAMRTILAATAREVERMTLDGRMETSIGCSSVAALSLRVVRTAPGAYRNAARTKRAFHAPSASLGFLRPRGRAITRDVRAGRDERARGRAAESVTRSARASLAASCTRSRRRRMRLVGCVLQQRSSRYARDWSVRRAEVREAETRGGRMDVKRGERVGVGRAVNGVGRGRAADVLCAVSAAGRGQAKRATYAGQARPPAPQACPAVLRRARRDSEKRDLCERDGGEGARDPGIVLTELSEDPDGGCLLWVPGAHEAPSGQDDSARLARAFSTSDAARERKRST